MIGDIERRATVCVIRASKNAVQVRSGTRQGGGERGLDRMEALPIVEAMRDSRLVGHQHNRYPEPIALRDGATPR